MDKSKRRRYKECLVTGDHEGKIVKGHLVPEAWLRKIATDDHVYVFATHSVNLKDMYSEQGNEIPKLEHVNNALVRYFTCRKHEENFYDTDKTEPDLSNPKILNLMAYKAIIGQQWLESLLMQAHKEAYHEWPDDEVLKYQKRLNSQNVKGLSHYRRQIERCLDPRSCKICKGVACKVVAHKVRHISGKPTLSVSEFCSGARTRIRPIEGAIEYIANWGLTILPTDRGHVAILHYFFEEEEIMAPTIKDVTLLNGRRLESALSELILKSLENIALRPSMWDGIGRRREAIRTMFDDNMPDIGFGSSDQLWKWEMNRLAPNRRIVNPNQINLFRETKR